MPTSAPIGGGDQRVVDADPRRRLSPGRAEHGDDAEDHGEEDREAPAAHPLRQHVLGRDVEARQHLHPGGAAEEARAELDRSEPLSAKSASAAAVPIEPSATARSRSTIQRRMVGWPSELASAPALTMLSKQAVVLRALARRARDQRQEAPVGGRERIDGERPHDGGAEQGVVDGVAQPGPDRPGQALGRQGLRSPSPAGAATGAPRRRRGSPPPRSSRASRGHSARWRSRPASGRSCG